jgi:hypothetical protein
MSQLMSAKMKDSSITHELADVSSDQRYRFENDVQSNHNK